MRLMMFERGGASALGPALGIVSGDTVIDLAAAGLAVPATLLDAIKGGPAALAAIQSAALF